MTVLATLPERYGWTSTRLDWLFDKVKEVNHPNGKPLSVFLGAGVVPRESREDNFNQLGADLAKYQLVRKGDLVFNRLRTWQGGLGASAYEGIVSPAYIVCRPTERVDSRFAHYQLLSLPYLAELTRISKYMPPSQFDILWDDLKNLRLFVPPLPTQRAIADYLDEKTAAIDAFIEKKRKLLDLLAEERAALINKAVTKGLDPTVPMKDSGIPWIGEMPAHWALKQLKHCVAGLDGIQMGPFGGMLKDLETEPTSFKLYGQVNTIAGDFHLGDRWLRNDVYEQLFRYSVQPGDVVLTRKGASIGYARLFPTDGQPGVIDSDTIRIRVNKEALLPHYALLLLHEALYVGEQILNERRGAILPNLNSERVGNLMLAVPDIAQQEKILLFVYGIVNERDRANRGIESQTDRLKEYRQALITAAVTGQLDIEAAA